MIIARGYIKNPDDVTVMVTLEMTMKELKQVREALDNDGLPYWPYRRVAATLMDVINQVEKTAYAKAPELEDEP
jgi:acylphosphatase